MKDSLGDRMKSFYESRTKHFLPRRTYTIIRIDGKAFHTFTRGLKRPFDAGLIDDMNMTTLQLCKQVQGCKFGYVQSDEISLLLTDFDKLGTAAWFDGSVQKMTSVSASIATEQFNNYRIARAISDYSMDKANERKSMFNLIDECIFKIRTAQFDSRVFTIPSAMEVENYFIWRQQDCTRNSISSVAQSLYSHKELEGVNTGGMQELIFQKGINWNDYSAREKRGGFIYRDDEGVWQVDEPPVFTEDRNYLTSKIPTYETVSSKD